MTGTCSHDAVVLARRTVWRPIPDVQFCDWCQLRFDAAACPECEAPAVMEPVGQVIVAFTTNDGRRWVVAALRGVDGRWEPERIWPADMAADVLGMAS